MKSITTLVRRDVKWKFDNLKSLSVYSIKDCTADHAEEYMNYGRGKIKKPYDLKVYCTVFKINFHKEISLSNGTYMWHFDVIKETPESQWLIDDWGY